MSVLYTAAALSTGDGRQGHVRTSDGLLDLDLAVPREMGGAGGATNPEQLFAAGYSACFHSALKGVAREQKIGIRGSTVAAEVGIGPLHEGGFGLTVALRVRFAGIDQERADELVEQAHRRCPYSNAIRGNVEVTVDAVVDDAATDPAGGPQRTTASTKPS